MVNDDLIDDGFLTGITQTSWSGSILIHSRTVVHVSTSTESEGFWSMRHDNAFVSL